MWRIYKIEFKKPITHVLVAEIDLLSQNTKDDDAVTFFSNLCKEGFAKSQMEDFYERHQATNKHTLARVLLSEKMLNHLRLSLRRVFPSVHVETKMLELSLRNEVLKRELIEGEEADLAASRVKKALRAAARQKRSVGKTTTSAPLALAQQAPPADAASSPPAVHAAAAAGKLP